MPDQTTLSSKDLLQQLLAESKSDKLNNQQIYEMEKEIEKEMEKFDMGQRERAAHVLEELSKLVITA